MEKFFAEISAREEAEQAGSGTAHFMTKPSFNVHELSADDMEMYEKIKKGDVTLESFQEYREKLYKECPKTPDHSSSREIFDAFLANLAGVAIMRSELEQMKKNK